jgi:hypothetical protein
MYEDPIPPKVRAPQVSDAVDEVILRCLEKKPERRYQTMRDLETDLARVREGGRPTGPDTVTLTPTRPPQRRKSRRVTLFAAAIGVTALAFAAAAALMVSRGEPAQDPPAAAPTDSVDRVLEEPPPATSDEQVEAALEAPPPEAEPEPPTADATKAKTSRPRAKRRKPKTPQERRDQGTTVILDPWK